MSSPQCPKCGSHADHIFTIEGSKKSGKQWAIERCGRCNFAGWPDNPIDYADYLKSRKEIRNDRRDIRDDQRGWMFGM